jgi:protein-arginine kinase activator protein McsA
MKALIVARHTINLYDAVSDEDFERAAELRDKIKNYNQTLDEELSEVYI